MCGLGGQSVVLQVVVGGWATSALGPGPACDVLTGTPRLHVCPLLAFVVIASHLPAPQDSWHPIYEHVWQ